MALKRFVNGAEGEAFFQKRAPDNRPAWLRVATLSFPSGRTADEIVIDEAAGLAWIVNLGCLDLNPHPVRADDLDHPDELRVDLDPVPGVEWPQIRDVAMVAKEALEAVGLVGWPKTSGSRGIHVNVRIERRWTYPGGAPGGPRPGPGRRAARAGDRDLEVVEGGAPRRLPRLQPERQGPDRRLGVFRPAAAGRPRLGAPRRGTRSRPARPRRSRSPPSRPGSRRSGIRGRGSTRPWDRWTRCSSCRGGTRPRAWATRRGRRTTGSRRASRPGSSRRRQRRAAAAYDTPEAEAEREKARAAMERRFAAAEAAAAAARRRPRRPGAGTRPTPTGRRKSAIPVIEISRAAKKDEALAGLERWKARWPAAAAAARAGRRPRRRDARSFVALVSGPGQPRPRPGGGPPAAGAARPGLRPVGRATSGRTAPASRASAAGSARLRLVCPGLDRQRL